MNHLRFLRLAAVLLLLTGASCVTRPYRPSDTGEPRTVVVWISVDGVRGDYIARSETPFLDRLMAEGAYSLSLTPAFPSLTFPSHAAQATGTTVEHHGVPGNAFHDPERDRSFSYPSRASLLQAEPIWTTAQRQNRRSAVYDWVLSHRQEGEHASAYFSMGYQPNWSDRRRVRPLLRAWRRDRSPEPLRLLMGYMVDPDKTGHTYGPDSPEIHDSMQGVDADLQWFTRRALRLFERRMSPDDQLILLITSDHGMSEVHTLVNPRVLTGVTDEEIEWGDIVLMSSGNIAHIYLHRISCPETREARRDEIRALARQLPAATVYLREDLPPHWEYAHPERVGDLVIYLEPGHTFSRRPEDLTAQAQPGEGPLGMHGYDPSGNPEMDGVFIVWRHPEPIGGRDLGPLHSLQLHPTVAEWLEIAPSGKARAHPIRWE